MAKATIRSPSLPQQIKSHLVDQMTKGVLAPGDRLIELRIAEEFGTSQAPVREALRELQALGLVAFRRNRGAVVRKIEAEELSEIYAVRAELEGFAAGLVARKNPTAAETLSRLCKDMETAVSSGDVVGFVDLNTKFHRAIITASENKTLLEIWTTLDVRTRTALNNAGKAEGLDKALKGHREIVQAISNGDPDAARRAMVAHVNSVVA